MGKLADEPCCLGAFATLLLFCGLDGELYVCKYMVRGRNADEFAKAP
jgi:hypothetical protein